MLRLQWNALRVGDPVLLHDDHDLYSAPLVNGVVAIVQTRPDTNDIAIRVPGSVGVINPRRSAVHLIEIGPRDICWRCEARDAATAA
jgi:hypothetical protein